VGKGAGYGLFDHHFAKLAHDQKSDDPGDGIADQDGRPGHLNRRSDTEKQAGTDSAAEGNELNMSVL
jgi:hypothetical protein